MADNIKIVGNILSTVTVPRYDDNDVNLIPSKKLDENFGGKNDYIEYYIYDAAGNLLNISYNYLDYKLPSDIGLTPGISIPTNTTGNIQTENVGVVSTLSTPTGSLYPIIEIDPIQDLQNSGYSSGEFNTRYNLFNNIISTPNDRELFIKEISPDRTELRIGSITLSNEEIETAVTSLIEEINKSEYFIDYLLNFGNNIQILAINIALNKAEEGYEILFKLYKPLPLEIQEKFTLWLVEEKTLPYVFDINLDKFVTLAPSALLRGPNFDIPILDQGTISTTYTDYSKSLISLQLLQSSSYQQLLNLMNTQSIQINVDYAVNEASDFNNFVFFSSAYQRTANFYDKVKQIEDYTSFIKTYTPNIATTASLRNEINKYSSSINTLISQFDGYESYLYFESSSHSWPKSGSIKPYSLLSTGSAATITWYNNLTSSAKIYDENNYDNLKYAVPDFIRNDGNNEQYLTFLSMVGHYFDNIWIYLKAVTDINLANNNLNVGVSKDLVYNQLQSLGIKLYSSQAGEALDQFLIGANSGSNIFNNDFSVTGSYLNNIPRKDLLAELYKRIYHNLPLLLKTKGTKAGLENLITTFGIPNQTYWTTLSGSNQITWYTPTGSSSTGSILNVKEFGGSLKSDLIKGYNNDKVRIVNNSIVTGTSGSVLSPLLSLQTYPTSVDSFRENDMHYVDISFSPETQMDTYISGAIASNNPTFSLDDFIGDPRQQYSGSYPDLDAQRRLYFQTGVPGFAPFTGSALDYNGFIRLIQYFDNSLFKMLNDFVPERTSLSTGVTITSPVLERNKVSYANPSNTTTQSVLTGTITTSSISSQYGNFYNTLSSSNNTMGWFDGKISGSIVNINQYFLDNYNPYLQPTSSIDQNIFAHTDWNVLLNNVSASVLSTKRAKIEYIGNLFPSQSLTSSVELQDSYLSLRSYNTSRYEGSKLTSLKYNTYSTGSTTIDRIPPITLLGGLSKNYSWADGNTFSYAGGSYSTFFLDYDPRRPYYSQDFWDIFDKWIADPNPVKQFRLTGTDLGTDSGKIFTLKKYSLFYFSTYWFGLAIAVSEDLSLPGNLPTIDNSTSFSPGAENEWVPITFEPIHSDTSYGKTAAIDRQSYKVGWVKNIPSQSLNFPDKTQIQLKYLVDKSQNITDLTLKNNNLFEVQNIFKSGDNVVLSLSDAIKPSFQKTLDGTKSIFKGGYSFDPILFRENVETLNFLSLTSKPVSVFAGIKRFSHETGAGYNVGTSLFSRNAVGNLNGNAYPSSKPSNPGWRWFYDNQEISNSSMASLKFKKQDWDSSTLQYIVGIRDKIWCSANLNISNPNNVQRYRSFVSAGADGTIYANDIIPFVNTATTTTPQELPTSGGPIRPRGGTGGTGGTVTITQGADTFVGNTWAVPDTRHRGTFLNMHANYTFNDNVTASVGGLVIKYGYSFIPSYNEEGEIISSGVYPNNFTPIGFSQKVNFTKSAGYNFWFYDDTRGIYMFDFFKFPDSSSYYGGFNTELTDVTDGGRQLFKAPRNDEYTVSLTLPFIIQASYHDWIDSNTRNLYYHTDGTNSLRYGDPSRYVSYGYPSYNGYPFTFQASTLLRANNSLNYGFYEIPTATTTYNDATGQNETTYTFVYEPLQLFKQQNPFNEWGYFLRIFGVIEKSKTPNDDTSWKYAASTRLKKIDGSNGAQTLDNNYTAVTPDPDTNLIYFFPRMGSGTHDEPNEDPTTHQCAFVMSLFDDNNTTSEVPIYLEAGECLRFKVYLIDFDCFLTYGANFRIEFGKTANEFSQLENIPAYKIRSLPEPFISIVDKNISIINYDSTLKTTENVLFDIIGDTIALRPNLSSIIDSGSIFQPTAPTSEYYSNVIDYTTVQSQDLIRVGSFNNPNPSYYTVVSTNKGVATYNFPEKVNIDYYTQDRGQSKINIYPKNPAQYTALYNFFSSICYSDYKVCNFNASGLNNGSGYQLHFYKHGQSNDNVGTANLHPYIFRLDNSSFQLIVSTMSSTPTITSNQTYNSIGQTQLTATMNYGQSPTPNTFNIKLDRPLYNDGTNLSGNFAILRPREDETSVIINFKKSLGDVSQTILIPQDANDEIKASVGTIFQSLNVDLSNQTQTNIP